MKEVSCLQGEDQKKLDIVANEVFINVLRRSGQCSVLVSSHPFCDSVPNSCPDGFACLPL